MEKIILNTLNKKFIISVISSSTFITGCTFAFIWFYLSNLDRLDIFFDAVNLSSTLGVIFFFILLSISGFSLIIFISSFILILIYSGYEHKLKGYPSITHRISTVCYQNSLFICCLLIISYYIYYISKWNGYIITYISIISIFMHSYVICRLRLFRKQKIRSNNKIRYEKPSRKKWLNFWMSLHLTIPGIVQILPIIFLFGQINFSEGTSDWYEISILLAITVVLVTLGILPGSIHINERQSGNKLSGVIMVLIFIPVAITALSLWYRPIPNMITNMTMNLSGISDPRPHQYYIEKVTHPAGMFNGKIWNTRYYKDIYNRTFITGVNIFTLGNIKLICPTSILKARSDSLKFTVNNVNDYKIKSESLKKTAMECISFEKNDIRIWDSPLSEPIYYEKIKQPFDNSMLRILHVLK